MSMRYTDHKGKPVKNSPYSGGGPGRTQQQFKEEVNINTIIAKYQKTGFAGHVNVQQGRYEDMSPYSGLKEAMDKVAAAKSLFSDLPPNLRNRFENNPAYMVNFLENPDNREEAIKLGIFKNPDAPKPQPRNEAPETEVPEPVETAKSKPAKKK